MENSNTEFIDDGLSQEERFVKLSQIVIKHMNVLQKVNNKFQNSKM
jgi:hypothetical protein